MITGASPFLDAKIYEGPKKIFGDVPLLKLA
jgi:hypothetical protein